MIMADAEPDFDALACARKLREAGVEAKQAEAHAEAARTVRAGLATKADLDSLETRFNARLDTRLAALETRLTIRFFGGMVAFGSVIVAAIELL